ncbi:MAG TPA: BatA domain-containing protein [Planctomycetaceae bacterium]|nr:BatA domain-containing protein [Planctomycetaceae bacterium]
MSPVLALGFAAPWLLWGLLLAVAPPIIHWLFRRRYRETSWAAMQFLVAAAKHQTRWNRLDQWLLLALRTLIPLGAAVALAGPTWQLATGGSSAAPVRRILVVDASLSLSAVENNRPRFAAVRDRALEQVAASRPGDAWQLVRLAGSPPRAVIAQLALQSEPVVEELHNLTVTSERGDVPAALETVLSLLDTAEDGRRREVHLVTDAQRSNWRTDDESQQSRIQSLVAAIGVKSRIVWTDVGAAPLDNVAVTELSLDQPYVHVGQPIRATATLERFGEPAEKPRTLEWRVDGRMVARQSVDLSDEGTVTQVLSYVPTATGDLRIQAELDGDALTGDDRRRAVCLVRDAVRVLLVDGRRSGTPFENATDALRLALAPDTERSTNPAEMSHIEPTVIADGELLGTDLPKFDVVFLCDVPLVSPRDAEVLKRYVSAGGSLVIAAGPRLNADSYNAQLFENGEGLLPAKLGDIVGDPARRDTVYLFDGGEFQHPILSPFRGNPNTGFELTRTFAYRQATPVTGKATVALAFDTGDPAIVERPFGRGRVLLVTTAVDRSWGTWAVWGHTFVPMMHETVRYLVSFRSRDRQLRVGDPVVYRPQSTGAAINWTIRRPGDARETVTATVSSATPAVIYESTSEPGFYGVESPGSTTPTAWFAVNVDPHESDLRPLSATELRDGLFGGQSFDDDVAPTDTGNALAAATDDAQSLARWLLGCVIVFLVCEPFVAWNRLLGECVAVALAATALAGWFAGPWAAVGTAMACAGVAAWLLQSRPGVAMRT